MQPEEKLERKVAAIGDLSREELIARWQKTYGCLPPKGINRCLLERSAAWHLQAERLGGLSAAARAVLRAKRKDHRSAVGALHEHAVTDTRETSDAHRSSTRRSARAGAAAPLAIGTRLMREWNGRMHVVDVTQGGILFDGKVYRSLTAVAKHITGTHWSGPRFFGL